MSRNLANYAARMSIFRSSRDGKKYLTTRVDGTKVSPGAWIDIFEAEFQQFWHYFARYRSLGDARVPARALTPL